MYISIGKLQMFKANKNFYRLTTIGKLDIPNYYSGVLVSNM